MGGGASLGDPNAWTVPAEPPPPLSTPAKGFSEGRGPAETLALPVIACTLRSDPALRVEPILVFHWAQFTQTPPQFDRQVDKKNTIYMDYISLYLNCYSSHTLDSCISNCYLSINHVNMKFLWSFNK